MRSTMIRNIRAKRNGKTYRFRAEIIKDVSLIEELKQNEIKEEIRELFITHWKHLDPEFFRLYIDHAKWLLLLRHEGQLVGLAVVYKIRIVNKTLYNFKLSLVVSEFRSLGLMGRMNHMLFNRVFLDNMINNKKLTVEIIFKTPNLRVLGFLANIASFIYPDPRMYDQKSKKISLPDDETWQMVVEYNKQDYPKNMPLSKEGCVVEHETDEWPFCEYEKHGFPLYKDEIVNEFGRTYLQYDKGFRKMFIVHAKITLQGLINYLLRMVTGRV